jgi:hypothetical protein
MSRGGRVENGPPAAKELDGEERQRELACEQIVESAV